jgi:PhnB protein
MEGVSVLERELIHARAIAGGATSLEAPIDTPHGDRRATVRDPSGNVWQVANRKLPTAP